jgi:hypothetical protein
MVNTNPALLLEWKQAGDKNLMAVKETLSLAFPAGSYVTLLFNYAFTKLPNLSRLPRPAVGRAVYYPISPSRNFP